MLTLATTPIVPENEAQWATIPRRSHTRRSRWLSDGAIHDNIVRHFLRTYTTPRHGSNGQVCWPIDEVDGDE